MPVIDNFLIGGNTVYFDTKDETSMPLVHISDYTGGFPEWEREKSDFKPYTPSVLDVIHTIEVLKRGVLSDQVHEEQLIKDLEEYLYGINQGSP